MSFEDIIKTLGSGLGQFGWNDLLDIAILTVLIYKLIVWTKDTRAYEVLKGVGFLIVASAAGALATTKPGAQKAMPGYHEVIDFLAENGEEIAWND